MGRDVTRSRSFDRMLCIAWLAGWSCGGGRPLEEPDAGRNPDEDAGQDGCLDEDGDGAGIGRGCAGDDCDDTDPATDDECGTGCEDRPRRKGCPCPPEDGSTTCYHGEEGTGGIGTCRAGVQACIEGHYGACEGQVLPVDEVCNELDEDCDGEADDGVRGECGVCGLCGARCWGGDPDCAPWTTGRSDGLAVTEQGDLTLDRRIPSAGVIWPSTGSGEYSRIFQVDTATKQILGSYRCGPGDAHSLRSGAQVDGTGALYFANTPDGGGSMMKIAHGEDACVDRNGSGTIDTSRSSDDALPFVAEDSWEDECILWNTELARPTAVLLYQSIVDNGLVQSLWIGLLDEFRLVELDVATGELTGRSIETPGIPPQNAVQDQQGQIWVGGQVLTLGVFHPDALEAGLETTPVPVTAQWLETDPDGWIWIAGGAVYRFLEDPERPELVLDDGTSFGPIEADASGSMWMVPEMDVSRGVVPHLLRIDRETLEIVPVELVESGGTPMDLSIDDDGQVWVFPTTYGFGATSTVVLDIDSLTTELVLGECFPLGCITGAGWSNPAAATSTVIGVLGDWTASVEACDEKDDVAWAELRTRSHVPPGTSITVLVRTGRSEEERDGRPWTELGTLTTGDGSITLEGLVPGDELRRHHHLAVQARFRSPVGTSLPLLQRLEVTWACVPPVS